MCYANSPVEEGVLCEFSKKKGAWLSRKFVFKTYFFLLPDTEKPQDFESNLCLSSF